MIYVYKQIWKWTKEYPDYEVSNYGQVKSYKTGKGGSKTPKILRQHLYGKRKNYASVFLTGDKKPKRKQIHQLVLENFKHLKPTLKHEVCHNDGNSLNNHILNLRWGTRKENHADKIKHGTHLYGSRIGTSKLNEKQVLSIKEILKTKISCREIGLKFGVHKNTIWDIKNKSTWV